MKIQHIRHGSHIISYKGLNFLVDPVFADQGTMSAIPQGLVHLKNPLVPMPFGFDFLKTLDGIFITHMHFDHFDKTSMKHIPKALPIYCHPSVQQKIRRQGFSCVVAINDVTVIHESINIRTTGGKHGKGLVGLLMGKTTGYILSDADNIEPKTYIIGDSIWYDYIHDIITLEQPDVIIVFAGEAKLINQAITMDEYAIQSIALHSSANIIAIHMDSWNHCYLTREKLKTFLMDKNYKDRIFIPGDGDIIEF